MRKAAHILRIPLGILLSVLLVLPSPRAHAAGSAVFTVEASPNPVVAGSTVELRFYVTPSGANVFGGSVVVTLTNLTYQSFDASGTAFNGYAGSPSGNSVGSTNFQIAGSHAAPSTGSSSKAYIGRVIVQSAGSAGTGTIALSSPQAADNNDDPMAASAQNRTVTIQAPQAPTCPSGQIGTPPNCTTPTTGGNGNTSAPSNPTTSPNTNSNVAVPSSSTTNSTQNSTPEIITEQQLTDVYIEGTAELASVDVPQNTDAVASTTESSWSLPLLGGIGAVLLVIVGVGGYIFSKRRRLTNFGPAMSATTDKIVTSEDPKPQKPEEPPKNGPTIISPGSQ